MTRRRNAIVIGAVVLAGIVGLTLAQSEVPYPDIPRGQGDSCVEDTEFMRRNHMNILLHQRDDTMIRGIRTKRHSLNECIACHAVTGPDAMSVTVESPQHFCRSCHDYAAVKIDCFQCHASRPEQVAAVKAGEK